MGFFKIDQSTKEKIQVWDWADAIKTSQVFAINLDTLGRNYGTSRVGLDIACHVARQQGTEPLFINYDRETIGSFLYYFPQELLVSINQLFSLSELSGPRDRLLTIGANSYQRNMLIEECDIVLNPCFNPIKEWISLEEYPERQVRLDYTCTPSRMRPDIVQAELFSQQSGHSKIIAAYIRAEPYEGSVDRLLLKFKKLHEKHNCTFLVSTGPATSPELAWKIELFLASLPGSEFYRFNNPIISASF
ncbi:MAG: hypothetical protein WCD70_02615 [Alphaproteobacteria bacterium]